MFTIKAYLALMLPVAPAAVPPPAPPVPDAVQLAEVKAKTLPEVIAKIQNTYDATKTFSAKFVQRYTFTALRRTQESSGSVVFQKPGLMRWDYATPSTKSFIIDGKKLWIHQPDDHLAFVDHCFKQDGLTASVRFLWGAGKIDEDFTAEWFSGVFGAATDLHIQLTPKEANGIFRRLILVVDPTTFRVKQSVVVDNQGNVNQFMFNDAVFDQKVGPETFHVNLPKGTNISRVPGSCPAP